MESEASHTKRGCAGKPQQPPQAPPLPPPPSTKSREPLISSSRLKPHAADGPQSNSRAGRAAMAAKFAAVDRANPPTQEDPGEEAFNPCHVFFYGSLMSEKVLRIVAKLDYTPVTQSGIIRGFKIKMWGIYPAAVPDSDEHGTVAGTVWYTDDPLHLARLQEYETRAYKLCDCDVEVEGGRKLPGSKMFCWAGAADSPELEDGVFDFERYQKYFMPSVLSAGTQEQILEGFSGSH